MRKQEEYRAILVMWETVTQNKSHIAEDLGIPRGTVKDCIKRYGSVENFDKCLSEQKTLGLDSPVEVAIKDPEWRKAYAYLLGTYLGDGSIDLMPNKRSYRMRIAQDKRYTGLIQTCVDTINIVLPKNNVSIISSVGCVYITVYSTHLVQIFPQHGVGKKHDRKLTFEDWQQTIIDEFPLEVFRGLYHSDGCRSQNIVNGTNYMRYMFANKSEDILDLLNYVCDEINLHWTIKIPTNSEYVKVIYVSRRGDVAYLDEFIGAKY